MAEIKILQLSDLKEIKELFQSVFSSPPWNDDWSDEEQLENYILDLIDIKTAISFGLYKENNLIGISLGHIKHWYEGTEYYIDELCIKTGKQGCGYGLRFLELIEAYLKQQGVKHIFLLTERDVDAYEFYKRNNYRELTNNVAFCKKL